MRKIFAHPFYFGKNSVTIFIISGTEVWEIEKEELVRFGVSMPKDLIEQFDALLGQQGYDNRSEALRDLVRKALIEPNRLQLTDAVAGTIVIVYDHHASGLASSLMDLQHDFHHEIVSTMHIHLNHQQCLEVIVVRGLWEKLRKLHRQIQVQKGVVYAELSMTHVDEQECHTHD